MSSVQLPGISGADSKLIRTNNGVSLVCSRHSAPDPPALDRPPVSKHDDSFVWSLTSCNPDLWPFQLKTGTPLSALSRTPGNVYTPILVFLRFFLFSSYELTSCTGQTDRQTDRRARRVKPRLYSDTTQLNSTQLPVVDPPTARRRFWTSWPSWSSLWVMTSCMTQNSHEIRESVWLYDRIDRESWTEELENKLIEL